MTRFAHGFGILFVALAFATCGCDKISINVSNSTSGVQGSGVALVESRELDSFKSIKLIGSGIARISVGSPSSFSVSCDDNIVPLIQTTVANGVLTIEASESISTKTPLEFDIRVEELSEIDIQGAVSVQLSDYKGDSLAIKLAGASSCEGSGTVKTLKLDAAGASSSDLQNLISENATVKLAGAGSANVHATKSFDGTASGVGSINCTGNPPDVKKSAEGIAVISVN